MLLAASVAVEERLLGAGMRMDAGEGMREAAGRAPADCPRPSAGPDAAVAELLLLLLLFVRPWLGSGVGLTGDVVGCVLADDDDDVLARVVNGELDTSEPPLTTLNELDSLLVARKASAFLLFPFACALEADVDWSKELCSCRLDDELLLLLIERSDAERVKARAVAILLPSLRSSLKLLLAASCACGQLRTTRARVNNSPHGPCDAPSTASLTGYAELCSQRRARCSCVEPECARQRANKSDVGGCWLMTTAEHAHDAIPTCQTRTSSAVHLTSLQDGSST